MIKSDIAEKSHENSSGSDNILLLNLAGEIQTPLDTVISLSSSMLKGELDIEQKTNAENIQNIGKFIRNIASDMFECSQINSGSVKINEQNYSIYSLINNIYTIIQTQLSDKSVELNLSVNPTVPEILTGDICKIQQILLSFISNSVRFTSSGNISCSIDWNGDINDTVLIFRIEDTGKGINPEYIENLFDASANHRDDVSEYTKISLDAAARLVKLMGGKISVESVYGQRSIFTIEIKQKIDKYTPTGDDAAENIINHKFESTEIYSDETVPFPSEKKDYSEPSKNIIDTKKGMIFFSDNKDEYLDILNVVYNDGYERIACIEECIHSGNYRQYATEIHALKSISVNIGASSLAKIVNAHEYACRHDDFEFIRRNFNILIRKYAKTLSDIKNILIDEGKIKNSSCKNTLSEYNKTGISLIKIADFIDDFDASSAITELNKLLESDDIDWIKKCVIKRAVEMMNDCRYQDVKNLASAMAEGEKS